MRVAWLILLLLIADLASAEAQVRLEKPSVRVDGRYDAIEEGQVRERLQGGVRIEQALRLSDAVDLILFAATGDEFSSTWVTFYDLRPGEDDVDPFRVHLRRAYLQVSRTRFRVQAGAIPPVKAVVSPTGLDPAGWIDGARVEWYNAPEGTIEFVAGRLGGVETPSLFARPFPFIGPDEINYGEVEASQQVRSWLRLEASAEYLRAPYARGEVRWMPGETTELFTELLYNLDNGAVNYGTTVAGDAFGRAALELSHAYKGDRIGLRGTLSDDFVTFGHSARATLTVQLSDTYGLRGRVEGIVAEATEAADFRGDLYTRFKVEVGWRLP